MIKTNKGLVAAALNTAKNHKSIYVLGAFGWPMTEANKQRAINANSFNRKDERKAKILAASAATFGFDCVCFVKALLWGWEGYASKQYGGAVYQSNSVPDIGEKAMLDACTDVSEDFGSILPGEYLWMDGHCGIYVGGGKAVECTYRWDDGVQETYVYNITGENGKKGRYWEKHGKLPYIPYEEETTEQAQPAKEKKGDYTMEMRNLFKGAKGEDVRALQILLIGRGYGCGGTGADGDFGGKTEAAVMAYQRDHGLEADGIAGKLTMGSLLGV